MTRQEEETRARIAIEDALSVTVKISHREEMKVVARDLIAKRNGVSGKKYRDAFDTILRAYYIDEGEWQDYVIDQKPII